MTEPTEGVDRRGRWLTIRDAEAGDELGLLALERAIVAAGQGVVVDLDEVSAARSGRRLVRFLEQPPEQALLLVASVDGEIAGSVDIDRFERRRLAHVGVLTMGVHPGYQGCGIGRMLLEAALSWADDVGVLRVELYMRSDNWRASRLYESVGFISEGIRRNFVRDPDGRLVDDVVMGRLREPE